jgi:sugar lactone lactonase YvrE
MIDEYVLPGDDVFPEGITEDPDGVTFYVSSSRHGTIFRGRIDAPELEVWQPGGVDGRTESFGMAVDGAGRLLVCGGGTGHLFAFDRSSGAQLARRTVPATSETFLNDVCVVNDAAYVTDSLEPVVWRLPLGPEVGEFELFSDLRDHGADPETQPLPNGIVPVDAGRAVLVAAPGTGVLWRVDVATGSATLVDVGGTRINGDGLVFVGDVLYICDNTEEPDGSTRYCLTALELAPDARSGKVLGRWERSTADTPTTAAYLDGRLYLVNSQFAGRDAGTATAPYTVKALVPPL